jgi:hypothetical protein
MNEDGSDATLSVEQGKKAGPAEEELEDYSGKVKKRIDKLTARLREHSAVKKRPLNTLKMYSTQNQRLEQVFQQTDTQRLEEMQNRVGTQLMALKHVIKKAREEGT